MNNYNCMKLNNLIGGGKLATSKLATTLHAYAPGRLPSFSATVAVALFVSLSLGGLSSCSGDDELDALGKEKTEDSTPPAAPDYASLLPSHGWTVASAKQRIGSFWVDALEAENCNCNFSADSVFITTGSSVNHFDGEGNVTIKYEIAEHGKYRYAVTGEQIQIAEQTFTITLNAQNADTVLVLDNQDWRLELKK